LNQVIAASASDLMGPEPKYQQLVTAGKPAKIAITAVMRKLLVTANALLKADQCCQQSLA